MRNCLVTGSFGFLGNAIVGHLQANGDTVIGVARNQDKNKFIVHHPNVTVHGDIRDYNFIRKVIAEYEIEEVYHCAAQAIVRTCANEPYTAYDINVMGTVAVLEACRNSGDCVKSIVVSSSDKAFGHAPIPYTEQTTLNPLYTYETSKACQQLITLSYFHNYGLPTKVIASSNAYGPGDPNLSRIIPGAIMQLAQDKPAILFEGAAEQEREFVFITDVASAFVIASRNGKDGELYCCGGTEHCSMLDLLYNICILMGKDPVKFIKISQRSKYFKEIDKQYIDSTKLKKIGWSPKVALDIGLKASIDYYSKAAGQDRRCYEPSTGLYSH